MPPLSWVRALTREQRIERAKIIASALIDHLREIVALSANNAILTYSERIATQIPRSHAAGAFNALQSGLLRYEILRLLALWDPAERGSNRQSIPVVVALVDDPSIVQMIADETASFWAARDPGVIDDEVASDPETKDRIRQAIMASERAFGEQQAAKITKRLHSIARYARILARHCARFRSLRDLRDTNLAHNLVDHTPRVSNYALKYGDERWLLQNTIKVVDWLNIAIRGTSFSWDTLARKMGRNAEALWHGVTVKVIE